MKRVLLLIKGLRRGGAERLLADGLRYCDTERFAYEVAYTLPGYDELVTEIDARGVPTKCLGNGSPGGWLGTLRAHVRTREIDLVHVHSPYIAAGIRLALPHERLPIVCTEHSVWSAYHPLTRWANALTFARSAHVFAVSEAVRNSMHLPVWARQTPVEVLYHGIDPERLRATGSGVDLRRELALAPRAPLVTTVASLRPEKGHLQLVRAALEVRRAVPAVRFVLIGDGPERPKAQQEVRRLGLEGTVIFAGPRNDAAAAGGAGDVFVLPSLYEGIPLALLEAMSGGAAVVATEVGGVPEVVRHGKEGLIVQPGDPAALAGALIRLLKDSALRQQLGRRAFLRAQEFHIEPAVRRIEAVYKTLLR